MPFTVVVLVLFLLSSSAAERFNIRTPVSHEDTRSPLLGSYCGNLSCIPGFDKMSIALDAVTGQLPKYPLPLFDFTFGNHSIYSNPFDSSQVWGVPNELDVITDTRAQETVRSGTFHTVTSYSNDLATSASVEANVGWFGASVTAKYARSVLKDTDSYGAFSASSLKVNLYDMVLLKPKLSADVLAFVAKLPETFDGNAYLPFIERYGTHFILQGKFGGRGAMSSAINKQYTSSSTDTQVAVEASVHFSFLKAGGGAQSQVKDASSQFTTNSYFQTTLEGGDVTLGLTDWNAWIKTFFKAPALISNTLQDIASLLPDSPQKKNVQLMTSQYLSGSVSQFFTISNCTNPSWLNVKLTRHRSIVNGRPTFCFDYGWSSPLVVVLSRSSHTSRWIAGSSDSPGKCGDPDFVVKEPNDAYVYAWSSDASNAYSPCGLSEWTTSYFGHFNDVQCSLD